MPFFKVSPALRHCPKIGLTDPDFKEYLGANQDKEDGESQSSTAMPSLDDQLHLLNLDGKDD